LNKCGDANNCAQDTYTYIGNELINIGCQRLPGGCGRPCGVYEKNTTCAADSNCYWDSNLPSFAGTQCVPKCSSLVDNNLCSTYGHRCQWNPLQKKCFPDCTTMNMNATFEGSMLKDNSTCLSRPECQWYSAPSLPRCQYNCMKIKVDWHCNSAGNCEWDSLRGQCNPTCGSLTIGNLVNGATINDNTTCVNDPRCEYRGGGCYVSCAKIPYEFCLTQPQPSQRCRQAGGKCIDDCSVFALGFWQADGTRVTDNKTCAAVPGCYTDSNGVTCSEKCEDHDENSCGSVTYCEWRGKEKKCLQRCFYLSNGYSFNGVTINSNATCLSLPHCGWQSGSCFYTCRSYDTSSSCFGDSNCRWDSMQKKCFAKCTSLNIGNYDREAGVTITSNATCQATPGCYSDFRYGNVCLYNCHSLKEIDCTSASGCSWDSTSKYCYYRCESFPVTTGPDGVRITIDVPYCQAYFNSFSGSTVMFPFYQCAQIPMRICPSSCTQGMSYKAQTSTAGVTTDYMSGCLPRC
jgi:hypothetical protein